MIQDGVLGIADINVVAVVPYIIMKTVVMGGGKPKDSYEQVQTLLNMIREK